jgi:hypothetical protein
MCGQDSVLGLFLRCYVTQVKDELGTVSRGPIGSCEAGNKHKGYCEGLEL